MSWLKGRWFTVSQPEKPQGRWARGWRSLAMDLAAEEASAAIAAGKPPPPVWRPPPPLPSVRHRADVPGRAGLDPNTLAEIRRDLQARELARRAALADARRAGSDAAGDDLAEALELEVSRE